MKSRLLKYVLAFLGLAGLGGLWGFSHFFFNPFESRFGFPLSTLLPRDVDFYVAKGGIAADFDSELRPRFVELLAEDPHLPAWMEMESVRDALAVIDFEHRMEELQNSLDQVPIEVDLLEVFGGSGMALGGYLNGGDLSSADWVLVGRANWMGKLGIEVIRGELIDLSSQGLQLTEFTDGFSLSGGDLARPLFFTRYLDVIAIATTADLIERVSTFIEGRGQDSFGLSAKFQDHRSLVDTEDTDLDVYVDNRALLENGILPAAWPDARAEGLGETVAGKLIQLGMVREMLCTLEFESGLTTHITGSLSSEDMSQVQKRFYRERGLEKREVLEMARFAPSDVGLFATGQAPLNDLLIVLAESLDEATLTLLEDPARNVWGYSDIYPLLGDLSAALGDRFALFLRNNDYPEDTGEKAPLHDDAVVLVWAVVFPVDDERALEALQLHVQKNPAAFGLRGRTPQSGSIFKNTVAGVVSTEYHSSLVPGTGHIALSRMIGPNNKPYLLISNHNKLLSQSFEAFRVNGGRGSLASDPWFETLVNTGLPSADLVAWFNPRAIGATMRRIAEVDAGFDVELAINWNLERPRLEKMVLSEHFPGERHGAVSPQQIEAYELLVEEAVQAFKRRFVREHLAGIQRDYERPFDAAEIMSRTFTQLSIDTKKFRFYSRSVLDEALSN